MAQNQSCLTPPVLLLGIAGASSSGKSTLIRHLSKYFSQDDISVFDMDGFHIHTRKEREKLNEYPEDVNANNFSQLISALKSVKMGHQVIVPTYDHRVGLFGQPMKFQPTKLTFVEGLHAGKINDFSQENLIDFSIFIYPDDQLRKEWKIKRDINERGYAYSNAVKQVSDRDAYVKKCVLPQVDTAEILLLITRGSSQKLSTFPIISPRFQEHINNLPFTGLLNCIQATPYEFGGSEYFLINLDQKDKIDHLLGESKRARIIQEYIDFQYERDSHSYSHTVEVLIVLIIMNYLAKMKEGK